MLERVSATWTLLRSLLSPCGTAGLFDDVVAPSRGDDVLVVDALQAGDLSNRSSVTPELIGMNDLWDIIFTQESCHKCFCGLSITMPLKQNVEYEPVLVYDHPKPVSNAVHACTHLVEMPP